MQDKLMVILVVQQADDLHALLTGVLGFEEGMRSPGDGGELAFYSYGSSNIGLATPGALPGLPSPMSSSLQVFEVADALGIHGVMTSRDASAVGDLIEGYFGTFFDVTSGGHVFRFLQKSEQVSYAPE